MKELNKNEISKDFESIELSNEMLKVEVYQCPHYQTKYKTKEAITKHIEG